MQYYSGKRVLCSIRRSGSVFFRFQDSGIRPFLTPLLGAALFAALFIVTPGAGLAAGALESTLSADEQSWLTDNQDKLILWFNTDFPPIEFGSAQDGFTGMGADVISLVEERLGIVFDKQASSDWNRHLAALESGGCAVAPTIVETPERNRYTFFTTPYASVPVVIITGRHRSGDLRLADLEKQAVAVVSGYATQGYLENGPDYRFTLIPMPDVVHALRATSFGQVDAYVENLAVAAYYIEKEGIPNLRVAGNTPYSFSFRIGVSRQYPELASAVTKALTSIPEKELDAVRNRWISLDFNPSESSAVAHVLMVVSVIAVLLSLGLIVISAMLKRRLRGKSAGLDEARVKISEQAELLQLATEMARAGQWVYDVSEDSWLLSSQWFRMLGYTRDGEKVPFNAFIDYLHPDDRPLLEQSLKRGIAGSGTEPFEIELRYRQKDGTWCWVLSKGRVAAWIQKKTPVRVIGLDVNIQSVKDAEETIRQSEGRLRAALNATNDGILVVYGQLIKANRQFYAMWNIPAERGGTDPETAMLDSSLNQLEDPEAFRERIRRISRGRQQALFEIVFKDGRVFECHSAPMVMAGEKNGRVWDFRDITGRKNVEASIDFERRQLLSIFDNMLEMIYVSDPETYELLYVNRRLREIIGRDPTGEICYKVLQGNDSPCGFCTNSIILNNGGKPYRWEYYNPEIRIDVDIVDQIIRWPDGRDVRLEIALDITEQKAAIAQIRQSEENFSKIFTLAPDMIAIIRMKDARVIDVNENFETITGWKREHIVGLTTNEINFWWKPSYRESMIRALESGRDVLHQEMEFRHKDGGYHVGLYSARAISYSGEMAILFVLQDVTEYKALEAERRKLQAQLAQAQKMEAVGTLAGGVAHDFNNMLGAIIGYTQVAMNRMGADDPLNQILGKILFVSQRSANLTRQLLAFARKEIIEPVVLNMNEAVENLLNMLERLIGENIELCWLPGPGPMNVMLDPSQLDQVLANLCVNARDAIGGIGRITIETSLETFGALTCGSQPGCRPGDYVMVAVSDDGCGMGSDILAQIYDPFFTTKDRGKGTGLGLSMVYGIVCQNNGFINVSSEVDRGSVFRIYFPMTTDVSAEKHRAETIIAESQNETLLVVEDDPALLEMSIMMLEDLDYRVISADTPSRALQLVQEYQDPIHLMITDVIMPEMTGRELEQKLVKIRPEIRTLFMSGYTADVIAHQGVLDEGVNFIQKPFSIQNLSQKIRMVLDGQP